MTAPPAPAIWVDADACPAVIKEILFRAAQRTGLQVTLVANHALKVPPSPQIRFQQVPSGFDQADAWICQQVRTGDLVITADIPLAAEVIANGATALNPRGERYTADTIAARLSMRDMMETLRSSGVPISGPNALNQRDRQAFANQLDQWLLQARRPA